MPSLLLSLAPPPTPGRGTITKAASFLFVLSFLASYSHSFAFVMQQQPRSRGSNKGRIEGQTSMDDHQGRSAPASVSSTLSRPSMSILQSSSSHHPGTSYACSRRWASNGGDTMDEVDDSATDNEFEVDWDWKALATSVFAGDDQRPIILFDGVCNLCNGGVNFAMDQDEEAKFRFCSLQSKVAQSLLLKAGQSPYDTTKIVLVLSSTETYFGSEAVSRICQRLDAMPLQLLGTVGRYTPEFIREALYQVVSNNRYQFGENDSCRIDFDGTYTTRFISDPADIAEV